MAFLDFITGDKKPLEDPEKQERVTDAAVAAAATELMAGVETHMVTVANLMSQRENAERMPKRAAVIPTKNEKNLKNQPGGEETQGNQKTPYDISIQKKKSSDTTQSILNAGAPGLGVVYWFFKKIVP